MSLPRTTPASRRSLGALVLAAFFAPVLAAPQASSQPAQPPPGGASAAPSGSGAPAAPPGSASAAPPGSAPAGSASAPPAGSASAPPAGSAPAPAGSGAAQPGAAGGPPRLAPPPPPPSPAQVAALAELEKEAAEYEKAAKDYQGAVTRIVQHHYEERRKRILSALDAEIAIERKGLVEARQDAIKRLEAFIQKYSGTNAHPEATPNAMFRLAALYEERARDDDSNEDLTKALQPAISMYKRIIREYPKYKEIAGVYYFLGHALNDAARIQEAQQIWRSLVCNNHFPYPGPSDPADPDKDLPVRLPQDHEQQWWNQWDNRHSEPPGTGGQVRPSGPGTSGMKGAVKGPAKQPAKAAPAKAPAKQPAKPGAKKKATDDFPNGDEMSFVNPYPGDCVALPQKILIGQEPKYVGEIWWRIGDHHFAEADPWGGAYNLNRAEVAYRKALEFKKPPVYGVAMYKLAWTYYKQQRYGESVRQFLELLRYTDEQEKKTGDPGTDFRTEAYTYIASSLTYLDFLGPEADEPYIPRKDVLDEGDSKSAEVKMHVAIDRVQMESVIPQKEKWTVNIYKALVNEFADLKHYRNTIELAELILQKWPMDRDAPVLQNQIAEIWERIQQESQEGKPERQLAAQKALEARTKLSEYVGTKAWVQANKDDPEALQTAERLVRGGLRRAAADHTNKGNSLKEQAINLQTKEDRDALLERALGEYRMASQGWQGYLDQDPNSPDAYESRYWIADANYNVVAIQVALDRSPTAGEITDARKAAINVRDSNEDDKFLQPAAYLVVATAFEGMKDQNKKWSRSKGTEGIEPRDQVKTTTEGDKQKVVVDPVPQPVLDLVSAWDDYVRRVPAAKDEGNNRKAYAFNAADQFFVYGQFADAKKRHQPIYEAECGKTEFGFRAWERLVTMANLEGNIDESRKLAEAELAKSCAVNEVQAKKGGDLARPTISLGYYVDAGRAFEKAQKMPDGPERVKAWREAAALYKVALEKAPARDEAPEAAMNGAYCYKQVGDYDQAIAMYSLFIKEYGSEENLNKLEKPEPKKYAERVKYLKQAYDALGAAYILFFNYRGAAETFEIISKNKRFTEADRRAAARNAVMLYANIGEKDKLLAARATFYALNAPPEAKAEIDFLVADAELKTWDENGADEGVNRAARNKAIAAMEGYHTANKNNPAANAYTVQAAYWVAKMRRVGKDVKWRDWCKSTTQAFDKFKASAGQSDGKSKALGSIQADMGAECAYLPIDEKLKAEWDYETKHHRYDGVIDKVSKDFDADLKKAEALHAELQKVIETFVSPTWTVAAKARQGSIYDAVRMGLYNAKPKLYTPQEEKLLKMAEESQRDDLQEKADALRQKRREDWRAARSRRIEDADKVAVKRYAEAVVYARALKVRSDSVTFAIRRLAFLTNLLTDVKMREYTSTVTDPVSGQPFVYTDGYFVRSRPGMAPTLKPDGVASPLPVAP